MKPILRILCKKKKQDCKSRVKTRKFSEKKIQQKYRKNWTQYCRLFIVARRFSERNQWPLTLKTILFCQQCTDWSKIDFSMYKSVRSDCLTAYCLLNTNKPSLRLTVLIC